MGLPPSFAFVIQQDMIYRIFDYFNIEIISEKAKNVKALRTTNNKNQESRSLQGLGRRV
jgi:hypothetical protein